MNVSDENYRVGFINGGPKPQPQGPIENRELGISEQASHVHGACKTAHFDPWVQFLMLRVRLVRKHDGTGQDRTEQDNCPAFGKT